jgi:hypothetical protein
MGSEDEGSEVVRVMACMSKTLFGVVYDSYDDACMI